MHRSECQLANSQVTGHEQGDPNKQRTRLVDRPPPLRELRDQGVLEFPRYSVRNKSPELPITRKKALDGHGVVWVTPFPLLGAWSVEPLLGS